MVKVYRIAQIDLQLNDDHLFFAALRPFEIDLQAAKDPIVVCYDAHTQMPKQPDKLLDTFNFTDAGAICKLYKTTDGYNFTMTRSDRPTVCFEIPTLGPVRCNCTSNDDPSLFRFGLWMVFNLRASARGVLAIHASVLIHHEAAVLCLGESGTGKSTHTRLWREHIPATELLNDDSPMIAIHHDVATVYGSPWSGKTPCYRNLHYPIKGFLRLSQAPENEIIKLSTLRAYGALQPSMPPSFSHDDELFDRVNNLLSELLRQTPVYHLKCLPNQEAAQLAHYTLYNSTT
ncbi:MAG: hypothetical protein IKU77_00615 [Alistipes sp.]|nr:hypothetical protein [Alistipes sp.]